MKNAFSWSPHIVGLRRGGGVCPGGSGSPFPFYWDARYIFVSQTRITDDIVPFWKSDPPYIQVGPLFANFYTCHCVINHLNPAVKPLPAKMRLPLNYVVLKY